MGRWLYEHVFRGIGILFLLGMLTILYAAVSYLSHATKETPAGSGKPAVQRELK